MAGSFFLLTLGCAKNQVDSRGIADSMEKAGWIRTKEPADADLLICNSCAFITPAKEETIETILHMGEIKKEYPEKKLLMCGCFPQRNAEELAKELPEVDGFFGTDAAATLVEQLEKQRVVVNPHPATPYNPAIGYDLLPGGRSAYLKIAEGCDNRCSYCAIPIIRGGFRPRPAAAILKEAEILASRMGILEINLVSQDTTMYSDPDNPEYRLEDLLQDISKNKKTSWIRALYLHPAHLRKKTIEVMCSGGKILPYFDLPTQHLSDPILDRMGRKTDWKRISELCATIRGLSPQATIRTTVIVGYPDENETDFQLLCNRLKELRFDKLGAFRYSPEEGTRAAEARPHPDTVISKRFDRVMRLQKKISADLLAKRCGTILPVLIEERVKGEENLFIGRSPADAPDVDGCVVVSSKKQDITGTIIPVKILRATEYDLYGEEP